MATKSVKSGQSTVDWKIYRSPGALVVVEATAR